jgi:hypothetical protein
MPDVRFKRLLLLQSFNGFFMTRWTFLIANSDFISFIQVVFYEVPGGIFPELGKN